MFQVINKQGDSAFTPNDEKVFESYLQFCGIGLRNAQLYEKSQLEVKRNQVRMALIYFSLSNDARSITVRPRYYEGRRLEAIRVV